MNLTGQFSTGFQEAALKKLEIQKYKQQLLEKQIEQQKVGSLLHDLDDDQTNK